jgi:hypothetical protein
LDHTEFEDACESTLHVFEAYVSQAQLFRTKLTLRSSLRLWLCNPTRESDTEPEDIGSTVVAALIAMPKLESLTLSFGNTVFW